MRITTRWLQQSGLISLRRGTAALARAQEEASSGRRVRTVSDDPLDAGRIMRLDAELRDIDRYQRNGSWANARMATEDTVLTQVRGLLDQARRIGVAAANLPAGDPDRQSAIQQIQLLKDQIVSLGNTRVGEEYVFAGASGSSPAFLADGTYVGDGTVRQAEVDGGVLLDTADTGDRLFGDALAALDDLGQQLGTGDAAAIQSAVGSLADATTGVLRMQSALGGRMAEIKTAGERLAIRASKTAEQRDGIRGADPAASAVRLSAAQTALEQAYAAIGKVLSVNLLDYLK